jgi:hypothetical protein
MSSNKDPNLPDLLADLRKRGDGFRTPTPGYFEELAERSIKAGRQPARTANINRKWLSLAASAVLIFIATVLLWPNAPGNGQLANESQQPASQELLAEIDASDIEAYIADNLDNFETELYATRVWGGKLKNLSLGLTDDVKMTIARGAEDSITTQLNIDPTIKAPIQVGQTLGELVISVSGLEVARKPLVALHEVQRAGFFARIWDLILLFISNLFDV